MDLNLNKEIKKVQGLLKIPVSDLEYTGNNRVFVYSDDENIGAIPCYIEADTYSYEVTDNVVNRLDWYKVYNNHSNEIDSLIRKELGRDDIHCQVQLFRQVRVSELEIDTKGDKIVGRQLALYECFFEDGKWDVRLIN